MTAELRLAASYILRNYAAPIALTFAACSWALCAIAAIILYPVAFLVTCLAVAAYVAHDRAEHRKAVRNASVRQWAFAQIVRYGGGRK